MTLMIDNLPGPISEALQKRAAQEGRSVQEIAVEVLTSGLRVENESKQGPKRDLSRYRGTWVEYPEFDKAIASFEITDEK